MCDSSRLLRSNPDKHREHNRPSPAYPLGAPAAPNHPAVRVAPRKALVPDKRLRLVGLQRQVKRGTLSRGAHLRGVRAHALKAACGDPTWCTATISHGGGRDRKKCASTVRRGPNPGKNASPLHTDAYPLRKRTRWAPRFSKTREPNPCPTHFTAQAEATPEN